MEIFEKLESQVRSYCHSFPALFDRAEGSWMIDEQGRRYLDFFAGAGALNYGHNHPALREPLMQYLNRGGITHSLDMATVAKGEFLAALDEIVLRPRQADYCVMFPGPTGTNAVEAALKLARKVTQRTGVIAFTNGFHGMTLGSLALTGNAAKRAGAGVDLQNVSHMPYCGYFGTETDTIESLESYFQDASSGVDAPAAFVVETVQAEGGVNVASRSWLQRLGQLARKVGSFFIVDDIQVGCGRTGSFFSFDKMDIEPDIICLSKSLSGYGIPLAVNLIRSELDQWDPGEHNGTFRGHNLAFVTARAALEVFWRNQDLEHHIQQQARTLRDAFLEMAEDCDAEVRGRGLIQGIEFADKARAKRISREAFERGLVIETAGPNDEVLKALPPLTITKEELLKGMDILRECVDATSESQATLSPASE